jgi:F-type H+-transporting ATPase subunit b
VRNAVDSAEKANAEAHSLLEKHKEMLRQAGREREEILKRTLQDAEALKTDLAAKARAESEGIVLRAREQVEREKNLAIQELRGQVADLAVEAASRIVKSSMTPDAQRKLVADFVTNLPKSS